MKKGRGKEGRKEQTHEPREGGKFSACSQVLQQNFLLVAGPTVFSDTVTLRDRCPPGEWQNIEMKHLLFLPS